MEQSVLQTCHDLKITLVSIPTENEIFLEPLYNFSLIPESCTYIYTTTPFIEGLINGDVWQASHKLCVWWREIIPRFPEK